MEELLLQTVGSHGARDEVVCCAGTADVVLLDPTLLRWEDTCVTSFPPILNAFAMCKACSLC